MDLLAGCIIAIVTVPSLVHLRRLSTPSNVFCNSVASFFRMTSSHNERTCSFSVPPHTEWSMEDIWSQQTRSTARVPVFNQYPSAPSRSPMSSDAC